MLGKIVVAMSGGVDSSVVAAILKQDGWDVIGVTLQIHDCGTGRHIHDAKLVADKIGIAHHVIDRRNEFRLNVIEPFVASYLRGETPNPCAICNQMFKFRDLIEVSKDLGAEALATGHYARCVHGSDGSRLLRGVDHGRDQSYFLFAVTREQLSFLYFPLGVFPSKQETRAIAASYGLSVADKSDSQDICFVPDGDYAGLISRLRPDDIIPGDIVDENGKILGHHEGIVNYTVGQRRGINLGGGPALYVLAIDAARRQVIVGPKEKLARREIFLNDVNWLGDVRCYEASISVKIRSTRSPTPATLFRNEDGTAKVLMNSVENGVSPGQACVFYDGEQVLGGGWIV